MTADSRTLASAASCTACLLPAGKVLEDVFFGRALFLELSGNFGGKHGKELPLQIDGEGRFAPRKKHSCDAASAGHQDRIFGAEQSGRPIAELAHRADSHVVTSVT